ncbi:MAG: FecR domain-containing protein [Limisphaerales bacterium]
MNSFRTVSGMMARLGVGAVVVALASVAQAAVEKGTAKVLAVQGSAEISTDGNAWKALRRGEALHEGTWIRTSSSSAADLDLGRNGSQLRIMPNSTVAFSALTFEETGVETVINTQIELRAGRVLGNVHKLSAASKYEVKSPKAVATIRGTRYDFQADGRLVVAEGSVVVVAYRDDGSTITRVVNANEMFSPVSGVVTSTTDADLGDVGGSASSVPGIVALPPLQSRMLDDRTVFDRIVLPTAPFVSNTQPKDQPDDDE